MQRSDALIKIVSFVVFLALVIYIGISAYNANNDPLKTVLADRFEMIDSVETEGYVIREEQILESSYRNISVTASEGERVAAGAAVAVSYNGSDALRRAEEIRELKLKIEQLSNEKTGQNGEEAAREALFDLSRAVTSGDMSDLDAISLRAETYILGTGHTESDASDSELEALTERLDSLKNASSADTNEIYVPDAGTFSQVLDGFEDLGTDILWDLTPTSLKTLFSVENRARNGIFGKLVTGIKWYYAAEMDSESASKLEVGYSEELRFEKTYGGILYMKVESIGSSENGKCIVVFSCDKFMQDVASLRELSAQLVFSEKEGLRVPKEAVHLDEDGNTFVYILQGLQARKVQITILDESGENYMAKEENGGLRKGDQIITAGNDLYNGKVVA